MQQLQFCAAGTAQQGPLLSPPRPQFVASCPRTSVPLSLVSWPSPPPWRVSPQLQRLGHCSWLLAELWKPPRLNAAPADVTAACDQSAARGPSVNHSASPGRGECRETAFRGSVAAASAARRGAGGGQRGARAPPALVRPRFRWEGLRARGSKAQAEGRVLLEGGINPSWSLVEGSDAAGSGSPGELFDFAIQRVLVFVFVFPSSCFLGLEVCPEHSARFSGSGGGRATGSSSSGSSVPPPPVHPKSTGSRSPGDLGVCSRSAVLES